MKRPIVASPRRPSPMLVCKKCLKRSTEGGKIQKALKRELRHRRGDSKKAPKLVSTGCFGICPKRAVVLTNGNGLQKGEYVLVSRRNDIEDALRILKVPYPTRQP
jgi:predicted metal-binding protein